MLTAQGRSGVLHTSHLNNANTLSRSTQKRTNFKRMFRLDGGNFPAAATFGRRFIRLRKTSTNGEPSAQPRPSRPVVANNETRRQGCRIGLEGH